MDRHLVGEVAAFSDLDRVDLSDQVSNGDVRGRELLAVALIAVDPRDLDLVAVLGDEIQTSTADGSERVVVDLAARDRGNLRIEEVDERAHDAALRLSSLTEHDHVVAGDDRIRQLRQHRLVIADDAGEERLSGAQSRQQVAAHLLLDVFAYMAGRAKLADRPSGDGHLEHYRQAARLVTGSPRTQGVASEFVGQKKHRPTQLDFPAP